MNPCSLFAVQRVAGVLLTTGMLVVTTVPLAAQHQPPPDLPELPGAQDLPRLPEPIPDRSDPSELESPPEPQLDSLPEDRDYERAKAEFKKWLAEMDIGAKSFRDEIAESVKQLEANQGKLEALYKERAAVLRELAVETRRLLLAGEPIRPDLAQAFVDAHDAEMELLITKASRVTARQKQVQALGSLETKIQGFIDAKDTRFAQLDLLKTKSARLRAQIELLREVTPQTKRTDVEAMLEQLAYVEELYRVNKSGNIEGATSDIEACISGRCFYALRAKTSMACGNDEQAWHELTKATEQSQAELESIRVAWESGFGRVFEMLIAAQEASVELWKAQHEIEARLGKPLTPVPKAIPRDERIKVPSEDTPLPEGS